MTGKANARRVALAFCIVAFSIAMGLRELVNIWLSTGVAGLVAISTVGALTPSWSDLFRPSWKSMGAGVALGLVMSVATWVLYPLSVELLPGIETEVAKLYGLLRQPPGPMLAFPVLVAVVTAEELVWRGLAIEILAKAWSSSLAVVFSAMLYVIPQIAFRSPLLVVVAFVCGILWGAMRVRSGGLVAPLVAHLTWDLLVFVLFPVA